MNKRQRKKRNKKIQGFMDDVWTDFMCGGIAVIHRVGNKVAHISSAKFILKVPVQEFKAMVNGRVR